MPAHGPNSERPQRIAIYCPAGSDYIDRVIEGVLRCQSECGDFIVRDFRYLDDTRTPADPPRWNGWNPTAILCYVGGQDGVAQWLKGTGLPIVNTSADVPAEVFPSVHATGATKLAADHLLSLGLTHFAYVGHRGRLGSQLLGENFRRALADQGHRLLIHEIDALPTAGLSDLEATAAKERGLIRFLDKAPERLGVRAIDDYFARVVCLVCRQLGLGVPGDVAVLGIEDTMQARTADPPLSTIRPPGEEVGYRAMHPPHSMLRGKRAPRQIITVPVTELIELASTVGFTRMDAIVKCATKIIEQEACRGLLVDDLCRILGVSRSTIQHRFAEQTRTTPGEMIAQVRLQRARELLSRSDLTIETIAGMVGFARSSIFSAFFKRITGETPGGFRARHE